MSEVLIGFVATFSGVGLALLGERYLKKRDDDERLRARERLKKAPYARVLCPTIGLIEVMSGVVWSARCAMNTDEG